MSWLANIRSPVRFRDHRYLLLREPYMQLRDGNVCEALLLYWAELQTRYRVADVAERDGAEAAEDVLRHLEAGGTDERMWLARSLSELVAVDLQGGFSRQKVWSSLKALRAAGFLEYVAPPSGTSDPGRYRLCVAELGAQLEAAGLGRQAVTDPGLDLDGGRPDLDGGAVYEGTGGGSDRNGTQSGSRPPIGRGSTSKDPQYEGENGGHPPIAEDPRLTRVGVPRTVNGLRLQHLEEREPQLVESALLLIAGERNGLALSGGDVAKRAAAAAAVLGTLIDAGRARGRPLWLELPADALVIGDDHSDPQRRELMKRLREVGPMVIHGLDRVVGRQQCELVEGAVQRRMGAGAPVIVTAARSLDAVPTSVRALAEQLVGYCAAAKLAGQARKTTSTEARRSR